MKNILGSCTLLFFSLQAIIAVAEPVGQLGQLRIEVAGLASDRGTVNIAVMASPTEFIGGGECFRQVKLPIQNRQATLFLTGIPFGDYAVKLYQDKNLNGKLDKLPLLGIPLEPYGFSNNARGVFGPPTYWEARFTVSQPETTIAITAK